MNKDEIILATQEKCETTLTKKEVGMVIAALQQTIMEAVAEGKEVKMVGFGAFSPSIRAAREGRNPKKPTETINIPASILPKFKAGKVFKEIVNA